MAIITEEEVKDVRLVASNIEKGMSKYKECNIIIARLLKQYERLRRLKEPNQAIRVRFCLELISKYREVTDKDLEEVLNMPYITFNELPRLLEKLLEIINIEGIDIDNINEKANELISIIAIEMMDMELADRALVESLLFFFYKEKRKQVESFTSLIDNDYSDVFNNKINGRFN